MKKRYWIVLSTCAAAGFTLVAQAQQPSDGAKAKSRTGTTPKGITWNSPPLPAGPIPFDTGV